MNEDPALDTTPLAPESVEAMHVAMAGNRRLFILVYHHDGVSTTLLPEGRGVVVGRSAPAEVRVDEASLSRRHARFTRRGAEVEVEDLGSRNGTRVNEALVTRARVAPGDTVCLGSVVVTLQALGPGAHALYGVQSHEELRAALHEELARARHFGREAALVLVAAVGDDESTLRRFCPRVQQSAREVDCVALYGRGVLEILLAETGRAAAVEFARALTAQVPGEPALLCGVAVFPSDAGGSEALIGAARRALRAAAPRAPVGECTEAAPRRWLAASESSALGPVVSSRAMRELWGQIERLAGSSIPVLIIGETGTGKEVVAAALHRAGPRGTRPICCVNCAAIPEQLVESTLFGHEKGAFTGAIGLRQGIFESADGGTVLLDEVGDLPPMAQAALLRVLESRRLRRVGGTSEVEVDVRVMAATHRDLESMAVSGAFRRDLLFRLNAVTLVVPPLRDRGEEIALLAQRFLVQAVQENGRDVEGIAPEAIALLEAYAWPGNVRELRNVIERAVVLTRERWLTPTDLPAHMRGAREPEPAAGPISVADGLPAAGEALPLRERVRRFEANTILAAMEAVGWNQTAAAARLGLPLRTLVHKLKLLGIKKGFSL